MSQDGPTWRPPDQRPSTPPAGPPSSGFPPPAQPGVPAQPGPATPPGFPPSAPPYPYAPPPAPPGYAYGQPPGAPPRNNTTRNVLIVVGIILAVLIVGVFALAAMLGSNLGNLGTRTPIEDVGVGQCFNGIKNSDFAGGEQVSPGMLFGVEVVDCAEEHEGELVARVSWPAGRGNEYPGDEEMATYAFNACSDAFGDYVGVSFESSTYEMTYIYPQQRSWTQGTRSIECLVHPPAGTDRHTGTVRDTRR